VPCHAVAVPQPIFGVSVAGYRVEGGFNGRGQPANQWAPWELAGKVRPCAGGESWWSDPERVLDRVESAGARMLAVSIEWARVEPAPGCIDGAALDGYAAILRSAAARGITPVGVLHDVAHPVWLGEEFWLTTGAPDRFGDHAARVLTQLAPACRHWVTLRQPNLVALAGWVDGRHPPRRIGALSDAWAVVDNFLAAHVLAYTVIHEVQPDAEVLLGLRASSAYDWQALLVDLVCAPSLGVELDEIDAWIDARRAAHDDAARSRDMGDLAWRRAAAATAPFGAAGPVTRGRLRRPSPRRALDVTYGFAAGSDRSAPSSNGASHARARRPLDSLLLVRVPPDARAELGPARGRRAPWERRPDPGALTSWCRLQADAVPDLPLWVEDGFATRAGAPRADGWDATSYVRSQLGAAAQTPVAVYLSYMSQPGGDPTWPDADFSLGVAKPVSSESADAAKPRRAGRPA